MIKNILKTLLGLAIFALILGVGKGINVFADSSVAITSLSPTSGYVGTNITIAGTGFTATNNVIKIDSGYVGSFYSSVAGASLIGESYIDFTIPDTLNSCRPDASCLGTTPLTVGTHQLSIQNVNGSSATVTLTVLAKPSSVTVPVITSIYPTSDPAKTNITITGSGFTASNNVIQIDSGYVGSFYNSVAGASLNGQSYINFTTPSTLSMCRPDATCVGVVPLTAGDHRISIQNANGTSNIMTFTITTTPVPNIFIDSISPTFGPLGTNVTISGTGFTVSNNIIQIDSGFLPDFYSYIAGASITGKSYIAFTIPKTLSMCRPDASCVGVMQLAPGTHQISIQNANGTSNVIAFTVPAVVTPVPPYPTPTPNPGPGPIYSPYPTPYSTPIPVARIRLMKSDSSPRVYYITEKGFKRWIPTPAVFLSYGNRWADIVTVPQSQLDAIPDNILIKLATNPRTYKLENNKKRWITSASAFVRNGFQWDQIAPVNQTELNYYANGSAIY